MGALLLSALGTCVLAGTIDGGGIKTSPAAGGTKYEGEKPLMGVNLTAEVSRAVRMNRLQ